MNKFEAYGLGATNVTNLANSTAVLFPLKNIKVVPSTPLCCKSNPFCKEIKEAKNILEIGCGFGRNVTWIIENTNAKYFGIDPNKSVAASFQERNRRHDKDRIYFTHEFDEIITENKYDVILTTYVFQHLAPQPTKLDVMNLNEITEEIFKVTKPGTIWFLIDHEAEKRHWQRDWFKRFNIKPEIYIKDCQDFEEIHPIGKHNLTIFKQK